MMREGGGSGCGGGCSGQDIAAEVDLRGYS